MSLVLGCRRDWKAPIRDKIPIVLFAGGNGREVVFMSRLVAWFVTGIKWIKVSEGVLAVGDRAGRKIHTAEDLLQTVRSKVKTGADCPFKYPCGDVTCLGR